MDNKKRHKLHPTAFLAWGCASLPRTILKELDLQVSMSNPDRVPPDKGNMSSSQDQTDFCVIYQGVHVCIWISGSRYFDVYICVHWFLSFSFGECGCNQEKTKEFEDFSLYFTALAGRTNPQGFVSYGYRTRLVRMSHVTKPNQTKPA